MSIEDFIDKIQTQDFTNASPVFGELMASKLADALDQAKIKIANEVFNSGDKSESFAPTELKAGNVGIIRARVTYSW